MGPRLNSRGKAPMRCRCSTGSRGFNGAAAEQPQKGPHARHAPLSWRASMEPRLNSRGKSAGPNPFPHNGFQRALLVGFSGCDFRNVACKSQPPSSNALATACDPRAAPGPLTPPARSLDDNRRFLFRHLQLRPKGLKRHPRPPDQRPDIGDQHAQWGRG